MTTESVVLDAPAVAPTQDRFATECATIATRIAVLAGRRMNGPLAELRRMGTFDAGEPPPEAFWMLVDAAKVTGMERERFWEAVVPMMVGIPHVRGVRAGRALRQAGVSVSRVERWLRLGAEDARRELRKLLRRIDGVDWVRLGRLLWRWDHPEGEALRRDFARDFFLERPKTA
jgi:CRISPR type I-E-associated protein CasB/Cse2